MKRPIKDENQTRKITASSIPLVKDAFFRSHVVELEKKQPEISFYNEPKWPEFALLFDTETTLDPAEQSLLFAFYRVCHLRNDIYVPVEEGIFYVDNLDQKYVQVIRGFVKSSRSEVISDDYDEQLHLYTRAEFVERVLFEAVRSKSLIVAFNAPWDISRLAVRHRVSRNRAWTMILSERVSRKTGELEPNPERPCFRITSKDSKAGFFSLTKPARPGEWPTYKVGEKTKMICRVLDLRSQAWALFNESHSLRTICKALHTQHQKSDHEPSGKVTLEDLEYARQDIRCTEDVLNGLKTEFDRHPIALHPEKAISPASIGKAYLHAMGFVPPGKKFQVPDYINGIASQAYYGGRAECRARQSSLPVTLTDFSSQYPTVNSLLGNPEILKAESVSFEDATSTVQKLVKEITLEKCFQQDTWKQFKFFARLKPENDILPVRAEYNDDGITKNIGVTYFSDNKAVWFSGPDVIASKLLTGKTPNIEKAIRVVPHGEQKGLVPVHLRGMVEVDPRKQDLFAVMVEQKQVFKESNKELSYFLKVLANSTSYGMFYELTPQKRFRPTKVRVFSGEHVHEQYVRSIEKPGEWYFPLIASLITAGGRLLLAMLECCLNEKGGQYLFCDTDSMCAISSKNGGWVACPNEPEVWALSFAEMQEIADRFESLNCYNKDKLRGSILKIEKVNFADGKRIDLFGYAISSKRYVLYRYDSKGNIVIVDAKAHGLGYLFPPKNSNGTDEEDNWLYQSWRWILEGEIARPKQAPDWFSLPAMMQITVSTPSVLGVLHDFTKPFNFVQAPLLFPTLYPDGKDSSKFSLIMPFSTKRSDWLDTKAFDTHTGEQYPITLLDPKGRTQKMQVKSYGNVLGAYREHPEAKFVGHDGKPCHSLTRGLLRRCHIVADRHRYIGKETSRRWEQGDDLSIVDFRCAEYMDGKMVADKATCKKIVRMGIRRVARESSINRETVALVAKGAPVKPATLQAMVSFLHRWKETN